MFRRALRAIDEQVALGNERFKAEGATFIRNLSIPDKYYGNHVEQVTASSPDEIARLVGRVDVEFQSSSHRCFYVNETTHLSSRRGS